MIYYIAAALAWLFIPLIVAIITWCTEEEWQVAVKAFFVALVILALAVGGLWGYWYSTEGYLMNQIHAEQAR
jgi:uncharacterized membrane protein AbrB (regulator of aidB expression)